MKTIERTIYSLAEEADAWKEEAAYWKAMYESLNREHMEAINDRLDIAKQGVANALMFALSVQEGPEGELVINKDNRKTLAENWK